jgi:hypothetical protein
MPSLTRVSASTGLKRISLTQTDWVNKIATPSAVAFDASAERFDRYQ